MNQDLVGWAVADSNNNDDLIGLDEASGGYPYTPASINGVKVWPTEEAAQHYCNVMNNPRDSYGKFYTVAVELVKQLDKE
jgi:hypothetical protein